MNEIVKKDPATNELATNDLFKNSGYSGFEETSADSFKTPFLRILQALSPEVQKKGEGYIEGAEVGLFMNSVSKAMYDEVDVVILKITHNLVVWKPNRGGFVGVFDKAMENTIVAKRDGVKKFDKEGNEVVDTMSLFCLNAADMSDIFVFPLSGASLKHAKNFASRLRMLKMNDKLVGVTFAGVWNLKTVLESNDKGSWYSIGSTPTFKRFVNGDELKNTIIPSIELLKKAETDYSQMDVVKESTTDESVEY